MVGMSNKLRWGVLSTADIALRKVLPAMRQCQYATIQAIASRDLAKAQKAAADLGIPKAYGSYEELLADPNIDVIYNPLPNQLHIPWTARAAEAGKHVLCEKPLSITVAEAKTLIEVRNRTGVRIGEAFMIRTHPQWLRTEKLIRSGTIGELRAVAALFSYHNVDPTNIRNRADSGGGAMYDIGCYCIQATRAGFGQEPTRVVGLIENDPQFRTDRLSSAILDFPSGQAIFTCGTQLVRYQRVHFIGTKGRIELRIPFNALPDRPMELYIDNGELDGTGIVTEKMPVCDQYTLQGDAFSKAILENREVPVPLEMGIRNMAVIEAVFRSAKEGGWTTVEK